MPFEMTPRERVLTALNHQEPDRVPTALCGGPYGLVDEVYLKLVELVGLGQPVKPFREGHNVSYIDDRLLARLNVDTRYVWPNDSPSSPKYPTDAQDMFLDSFGQPWKRAQPYYYPTQGILAEANIDQIETQVKWPTPSDPCWTAGVRERARALKEGTDCFVIARMISSYGPYLTACNLRGAEQFLMDMALDEDFAIALVGRVTDMLVGLLENYLEAGGEYFDMVELPGDDYASSSSLVMSPVMFRKIVKPAIKRLVHTIKEYRADIKVMLHSDGMIEPLLTDFIDIGVDVIHPLEPVLDMDQAEIKTEFGERIAFLGGIDIVHRLPGSRQDVIDEVKERIRTLAPGGGYVLAPANHIQSDVPARNVVTLYQAAQQYGRYPLRDLD
jgi:uroporphyrinogen decarboxylase